MHSPTPISTHPPTNSHLPKDKDKTHPDSNIFAILNPLLKSSVNTAADNPYPPLFATCTASSSEETTLHAASDANDSSSQSGSSSPAPPTTIGASRMLDVFSPVSASTEPWMRCAPAARDDVTRDWTRAFEAAETRVGASDGGAEESAALRAVRKAGAMAEWRTMRSVDMQIWPDCGEGWLAESFDELTVGGGCYV